MMAVLRDASQRSSRRERVRVEGWRVEGGQFGALHFEIEGRRRGRRSQQPYLQEQGTLVPACGVLRNIS